ncbi:MAG: RNA polymerase sigma-54 factor [Bacteroidetes bacterium GWA2_32_17]|nr:MAG: RNA polymerase sigma-54 factor [Bacteroidetes bacterium GWA2_32_17]
MLDQRLQQKLLQKLSPQQIQLIKLLEIPTMELEQRIKKELEENPALEEGETEDDTEVLDNDETEPENNDEEEISQEDENLKKEDEFSFEDYIEDDDSETPYYNLTVNNYSKNDEVKEVIFANGQTFHESLLSQIQLRFLSPKQTKIAEYIIGNIDEDGYLRRDLMAIVDDLAFLQNIETRKDELEEVLKTIQQLDPPGIGARNLQECLLFQILRKDEKNPSVKIAITILNDYFEEFTKKHYTQILKKLSITEDELKKAVDEIIHLSPKPGNTFSDSQTKNPNQITPDFIVENNDGKLFVSLNSPNATQLKVSPAYASMIQDYQSNKKKKEKREKEAISFARQKVDSAKWFIDALQQRQNTLILTMNAIANYQYEFFKHGDETFIKPMILKDIADITGLDISTISRVANSKYVQTQFGIYSLKYFFSESMQNDAGEEVSTREIKQILQDEIGKENKSNPLTDEELTEVLLTRGYPIARRTIAKYREQLNIPVGRLRKEL